MEYSKPVIAATDRSTDLKDLVESAKCGEWVWSGDKDGFVEVIRRFSKSTSLKDMGSNGRKYLEENFNLEQSVKMLEKHLNLLEKR